MKRFIYFLGCLLSVQAVWASSHTVYCVPVTVKAQNKMIILRGSADRHAVKVYFLHNTSRHSLWLDRHNEKNKSANAGWSSYLRPGNWSAIQLGQQSFPLSCAIIRPGKVDYQTCIKAISVCSPAQINFKTERQGSYWLVEDKSLTDIEKAIEKRGILIKKESTPHKKSE